MLLIITMVFCLHTQMIDCFVKKVNVSMKQRIEVYIIKVLQETLELQIIARNIRTVVEGTHACTKYFHLLDQTVLLLFWRRY